MRILDLFAGYGGFSYGAEKLVGGYTTTQFVEKDEFCQKILKKHWPNVPIHDDINTFNAKPNQYELLTIGWPCQDISVAGNQRGIKSGTRSSLFYQGIRLLRELQPRFALFENVRNLIGHDSGKTFKEVLFQIAKSGYDAEWQVLSVSKHARGVHRRERVFIIAYPKYFRLSPTERLRIYGEANNNTQERQNKIEQLERSCESIHSKIIQRPSSWSNERYFLNPNPNGYSSKPTICRTDNGFTRGLHKSRITALGNGVVPHVAAIPLQRIKKLNEYFSTIT